MKFFKKVKEKSNTLDIIRERFRIGRFRANEVYKIMQDQSLDINDAWKAYTEGKDIDD